MAYSRTAGLALMALLATSAANAQNAYTEIDDAVMVSALGMTADKLDDLDVYDAAGKKIGDVEEVLGTDAKTPTAVAVDFDEDALAGDEDRVVELTALTATEKGLVLSLDAAALRQLPVYED